MRFPGFEGEWESKKLDSISEFINIKIPSESLSIENYISTENILQNFEGITTASSVPSNINVTSFKDGDILMSNIRPYLKKVWKATKAGGCSSDVLVFRKNETCLSEYLYYLIANDNFINYVMIAAKGVKMPRGDKQQIQQYLISLPSICEQQKIAAFLSLIDERISRLTKIIEGLQSFKNAVIKKIFSQELRFSVINSEWRKIKLIEVCEKQSSNISANKIEDNFGEYVIYGASGKLKNIDFYDVEDDYISIVKDGAGVGRLFYCKGKSSVLGTLDIIKPKNGIHTYFLYCLLSSIDFSKYVTGSTIPHIYFKDYSNEIIGIPMIEEQTKIADFIFGINEKISLETSLLQQLKLQKQYFLKQMFL